MAEFDELNNDPNLDIEKLQAVLEGYQREYREEMERQANRAKEAAEIEGSIREFFQKISVQAAAQVAHLSQYASSDAVRLAASKFIVIEAFKAIESSSDPLKEILQSLQGPVETEAEGAQ